MNFKEKSLISSRFRLFSSAIILLLLWSIAVREQDTKEKQPSVRPAASPTPPGNQNPNTAAIQSAPVTDKSNLSAEQVAESVIFIYGGGLGRINLNQIRKTTMERGKISTYDAKDKEENSDYELLIARGEGLETEKVRIDRTFPNAKFSLISNAGKTFGIFGNSVFTPREDAVAELRNRIWRGLEGLLRYKESGSTLELAERQKILGVEFYVIDVTDKNNLKTRYFVSYKSFRIMALEYTEDAIKYKRKFYDYNYAQGTLVPYRSVLWADEKKIEEVTVQTVSFGQKIEDYMFEAG